MEPFKWPLMRALAIGAVVVAIWSAWLIRNGLAGFQYIALVGLVLGAGTYVLSIILGGRFVWSLAPLWSEREHRYYDELRDRPALDDEEFFKRFYSAAGIPKDIPIRLRRLYQDIIGCDLSAMQPHDNLALIFDALDFADVLYRVEREFEVKIPLTVCSEPPQYKHWPFIGSQIDGTFDSVVRYLAHRRQIDLSHGPADSYSLHSQGSVSEAGRHAGKT
jgi:hypothetical protein